MGHLRPLTTMEVERLLFEGRQIVIMDGNVLQLDGWLKEHPGGKLAILHMVGRDASNEIHV
jgi:delta8-fatty-acid desaturase